MLYPEILKLKGMEITASLNGRPIIKKNRPELSGRFQSLD